jgi:hypothetical protein
MRDLRKKWSRMAPASTAVVAFGLALAQFGCQGDVPTKTNTEPARPAAPAPKADATPKKQPQADNKPVEITLISELDAAQADEMIEAGFHPGAGPATPDSRVALSTFKLTRAEPKVTNTVTLKPGDYRVKLESRSRVVCNMLTITAAGAGGGVGTPSKFTSNQTFRINADTSDCRLSVHPALGFTTSYELRLEPVSPTRATKDFSFVPAEVGRVGIAKVILNVGTPIVQGAEVWALADGHRMVPWPAGTTSVEFFVSAGPHTITVVSAFQGKKLEVFKKSITAAHGSTTPLIAGN